jgi:hypothetical protein
MQRTGASSVQSVRAQKTKAVFNAVEACIESRQGLRPPATHLHPGGRWGCAEGEEASVGVVRELQMEGTPVAVPGPAPRDGEDTNGDAASSGLAHFMVRRLVHRLLKFGLPPLPLSCCV